MKKIVLSIIVALIADLTFSQTIIEENFKAIFDNYGVEGCFVLFNQSDDITIRYNSVLCDSGYIPASTFKIPNSVLALEECVVKDTSQVFIWNGYTWPNEAWNRDQTLKSAMKASCIWVFFEIAGKIGIEKYYGYVKSFDYGNKNLTGPPTRFWLAGEFRISANQQIEFLRKFYNYQLRVSKKSIDIVKDLIIIDHTDYYTLSGKTGGGMIDDTDYIMWLVGYIEKDNKVYFYAMNFKTQDYEKLNLARYYITNDILKELKIIE